MISNAKDNERARPSFRKLKVILTGSMQYLGSEVSRSKVGGSWIKQGTLSPPDTEVNNPM
jgi:hypothetical protein